MDLIVFLNGNVMSVEPLVRDSYTLWTVFKPSVSSPSSGTRTVHTGFWEPGLHKEQSGQHSHEECYGISSHGSRDAKPPDEYWEYEWEYDAPSAGAWMI